MTTAASAPPAIYTPSKTHKVSKHHISPAKPKSATTSQALHSIDARIAALTTKGTPQLPYIITLPEYRPIEDHFLFANYCAKLGDVPHCGHVGEWEHKTYHTYIARRGENLLQTTPHPGFVPGTKGMLIQPQKKKISLADYKKRQVDSPGASNGDDVEHTNGASRADARSPPPKRPASNHIENDVPKKQRLSPPREKAKFAPLPPKVSPLPPDPLPPLLSPDLPPIPPLPAMLSPISSMSDLEAELTALKEALVTPPRQTNKLQVPSSGPRAPSISPMTADSTPKIKTEKKRKVETKSPSPEPPRRKSHIVILKTPGRRSNSPTKRVLADVEEGELVESPPKKSRTTPQVESRSRSQNSMPSTPARPLTPRTKELVDSMSSEASRLSKAAITLKRSMDARLRASSKDAITTENILAVAEGVDSILCFVLSFTYEDEISQLQNGSSSHKKKWRTLPAYLGYVESQASTFREIFEALRQIGVVIRSLALEDELHDPAQDPVKRPWLQSWRDLKHASAEAMAFGQPSRMRELLPSTWEARSEKGSGEKKARPGALKGPYRLPFVAGVNTSLEAVRFGVRALKEWTALKKVSYHAVCTI